MHAQRMPSLKFLRCPGVHLHESALRYDKRRLMTRTYTTSPPACFPTRRIFVALQLDLNSAPQNLVAWPTEPILKQTRAIIPPAFGVDISPIVWVMICSLVHEILLGQQGILNLMSSK